MNQDSPVSHVFYVLSHGYAADHWYAWFVKAINAHPEMLAYLANEGSRPKYFDERSRSERPSVVQFTHFLADVGMTYTAIGDCYSYRTNIITPLSDAFGDQVRIINLVRHPYVWLKYYVRWRTHNMRMPQGSNAPLEHEWKITQHDLFREMKLRDYTKEDINIWATYQGMLHLNNIISDSASNVSHYQLEKIVNDRDLFVSIVEYLTHGRIKFTPELLNIIYSWVWRPFRGEEKLRVVPAEEFANWPEWKHKAFDSLHTKEARECYKKLGYSY